MAVRGKQLDFYIEAELETMLRKGYARAAISATAVHKQLLKKGYVQGGISVLSKPHRKQMIEQYALKQKNEADEDELDTIQLGGRNSNADLKKRNQELMKKNAELQRQLDENTLALLQVVKKLKEKRIDFEQLLSPMIIRELKNHPG